MITLRTRIHKLPLILFFLLSLYTLQAQTQELSEYYYQQIEGKELALKEREQLFDSLLRQNNINIDTLQLVKIYRSFVTDLKFSDLSKSMSYIEKIEKIADLLNNFKANDFKMNHRNKISILYRDQQYYKVLKCGFEYLKRYPETDKYLGNPYRLMGKTYVDLGDFQQAISYYDKSIYILETFENKKELSRTLISKLKILVSIYEDKYSEEIIKIKKRLEPLEDTLSYDNKFAVSLNLGIFYDKINDNESAIKYYRKSYDLSIEEENDINIAKSLNNLGVIYTKIDSLSTSRAFLNEALIYSKGEDLDIISNNFAEIYLKENNYQQALIHYQKAITEALHSKELDYQSLPSFQDIELSPNKLDILGYLIDKANGWIAYYEVENKTEYLQNALETFTLADKLIDVIYVESSEDLSKLFWREKSATFYPKAVEVCYRLQQPEKAFSFMEKNKAMLLLENMTNATAKRLSKLPENLLKREQNLIKKVKMLEAEMQIIASTESQQIDAIKNNVFNYKKEYDAFIDSLETSYPRYYKYKKNINIVTLKNVQENLQADELILQYIVGKEKGFVALISPEIIQLQELPNTKTLREMVTKYKNAVSKPFVNKEDKNTFQTVAKKLYQQLIPFSEKEALSQKRITIIADGMLQYIPFETLLTPSNEYLIQNAQVHYSYSLSSAAQSKENNTPISNTFIAIAPTKFKDEQHTTLATSSAELKKLTSIFGANHFQYEEATKERFTEAYGNYKIVHLSTHGGIENTIPWMAFYDEKMTLDELYFSKNQSELVVLSACKTSDGELKKGEGVMSLARGFFNAGAKSVISSLWDINEKASSEIIQEFYKNIVAGDTKSLALQKAKLTYIKKNNNTSEASPYYWSALTLTGDISPIDLTNNKYLYYILGAILLTGIVIFIRLKRNKKQAA